MPDMRNLIADEPGVAGSNTPAPGLARAIVWCLAPTTAGPLACRRF